MSFSDTREPVMGGLLLAIFGTAALTALATTILFASDGVGIDLGGLLMIFAAAFFWSAAVVCLASLLIGLPLTWLLSRLGLEQPFTYPLAGFLAGGALIVFVPVLIGELRGGDVLEFLPFALIGALPGTVCGAIWWFAHRRDLANGGEG